jgi:hypothetical protein
MGEKPRAGMPIWKIIIATVAWNKEKDERLTSRMKQLSVLPGNIRGLTFSFLKRRNQKL